MNSRIRKISCQLNRFYVLNSEKVQNLTFLKKFTMSSSIKNDNSLALFSQNSNYSFHFYEEKFQNMKHINNENIINCIKTLGNSNSLNETIFLIFKVSEFITKGNVTVDPSIVLKLANKVKQLKIDVQNQNHEDLMIGTLALSLSRFDFLHDEDLWLILGDHIIENRFFSNFSESLNGLEGFRILSKISGPDFYDQVYSKLEEICFFSGELEVLSNLTRFSKSVSMQSSRARVIYQKIANIISEKLVDKIEISDLLMICHRLVSLSLVSPTFISKIQPLLTKELETISDLQPQEKKDILISIVKLYSSISSNTNQNQNNFSKKIEEKLILLNLSYNFNDIIHLLKSLKVFSFSKEDHICSSLIGKLLQIEQGIQLCDIIDFYDYFATKSYQSDHSQIPQHIIDHFDRIIANNIEDQNPQLLFEYIHNLNNRSIIHLNKKTLSVLIFYIVKRLRDHSPEQLSEYFAIYDNLSEVLDTRHINNELMELQEFIRIISEVPGFG